MIQLFSHNDLDGKSCGLLIKLAYGEKVMLTYCTHENINPLVEQFLDDPRQKKNEVYITDIAVKDELAARLDERYQNGGKVHLIDHHATAMHFNAYEWGSVVPRYEDGRLTAATSLLYDHLVQKGLLKDGGALKEYVELVRLYDTWEWFGNNETAKRLNDLFFLLPQDKFEEQMLPRLEGDHFSFSETEETILNMEEDNRKAYINKKQKQMVEIWDTFTDKEGHKHDYKIGIVHAEQHQSELGNELNRENPHLDLIVILNAGNKRIGYRTIHEHVDVSQYAKQFNGGGHPKASGSTMTPDAFEKFVIPAFKEQPRRPDVHNNEENVKENPKGTRYVNHQREVTTVYLEDSKWKLEHKNNIVENKEFADFTEAENYVKRHYNSWLIKDDDLRN
ncbi:DHH family phosphoesterase [Fictibacillus iocasae]|uniref:DHH family phosphoesterase n=1 Tax=Fictibacillus iocasae TaxID=2715437 RepID=A0ABW2NV12_9BACL